MFGKVMARFIFTIAFIAGLSLSGFCEVLIISCDEVQKILADKSVKIILVDVRSSFDFEKKHIYGALNIPYNIIDKAGLPKDGTFVLYCSNEKCPLSHLAAKTLESAGYTNLKVLKGGLEEWENKNFPVESGGQIKKIRPVVKIHSMTALALKKNLKTGKLVVIDTRLEKEFLAGHIPGAKNIPLENLKSYISELDNAFEFVVYDRQNNRAMKAAKLLAAEGFKVFELSGGLQVWCAKKYPLETGAVK
ncbi:MAG: hypothetical protein HY746_05370 [Elusimicrobia bacterium]|nr:hypothetical protein [Elusimicrobiota bacterium]